MPARLASVADGFAEFDVDDPPYGPDGPLAWPGYGVARKEAADRAGTAESVACGRATVGGVPAVLVEFTRGTRGRPAGGLADADDPAYTAESQYAAGHVDELVTGRREPLADWLALLSGGAPDPAPVPRALGSLTPAASGWEAVRRTCAPGQRPIASR